MAPIKQQFCTRNGPAVQYRSRNNGEMDGAFFTCFSEARIQYYPPHWTKDVDASDFFSNQREAREKKMSRVTTAVDRLAQKPICE